MTTSSATEVDSGPRYYSPEWVERITIEAFDELRTKIASSRKLHPSEELNRDANLQSEFSENKIYDMINSYHSYCRLCEQHFYSRSYGVDINSFFQKHLNTSYHRQMRTIGLPPDEEPIFTWETQFHSGRCHVCNMSGLRTYMLNTKFDMLKLMKIHSCVWDRDDRETNEKVLRKLTLLRKYCGLSVFRRKLIKTVDGRSVCLLCGVKLPWPKDKAACHLSSDGHYQKFCVFLKKCFNFAPTDVLNGFNLEMVTQSVITRDPPPINNFSECHDDRICLEYSNCNENPYPEDKDNHSFSMKDLEEWFEGMKLTINENMCPLCNVPYSEGHRDTEMHQTKLKSAQEGTFFNEARYATNCKNKEKGMRIAEFLENLDKEVPTPSQPSTPGKKLKDMTQKTSFQVAYLKKMLKDKLQKVSFIFTVTTDKEVFCQVCDEHVSTEGEIGHLNSPNHKFHEEKWNELMVRSENEKFFEPFVKLKNLILCLLCGAVMMPCSFYPHLKSDTHRRKFEWYSNLNFEVAISNAFVFNKDFSSTCIICNWPITRKSSFTSLKATLKNVKNHWPCPKLRKQSGEVSSATAGGAKDKKKSFDFEKVEKTVDSLVTEFEEKIEKNVMDKLDNTKLKSDKESKKVSDVSLSASPTDTETESHCQCENPSECSCLAKAFTDDEKEEKSVETAEGEDLQEIAEEEEEKVEGEEEEEEEEEKEPDLQERDHEVLIITGLPKSKRTYDVIYSTFNHHGKIRYVFFDGKHTFLAFEQQGLAEEVAKNENQFINNYKVELSVAMRKARAKLEKPHTLNKTLIPLLQHNEKLMDFVMDLTVQSKETSESPEEKKREEWVCKTIISAISECFPQGRCYPFGSRLSGLTLNNSDLDVFFDSGGMYEGFKNTTPSAERRLVTRVGGLLRKKWDIADVVVVDRARVPIVSFLHKPTLMHCDVSFKNGLSIQNTLMLKFIISLDWRVKPFILFLKHWAKVNDLHGPPNFSSYAIAMMVIFYLEQLNCPVLPTIESLQKSFVGPRKTIAGWDCSINTNVSELKLTKNRDSLQQLLKGFFKYYANFDYGTYVISPLTGKLLRRKAFSEPDISELPLCYKRQILNLPTPIENLVNEKIQICVIDPFDLSHVLTKSFTPRGLQGFVHLCRLSEQHLKKGLNVKKQAAR